MHFIDSHCHLSSPQFKQDWKGVVVQAKNAGVFTVINVGSDLTDSEWGRDQAEQTDGLFATAGIHPESLAHVPQDWIDNLRRLVGSSKKIVAIGEIGLDYTLDPAIASNEKQINLLKPQLELAAERHLPTVLHVRDQKDASDCFNDLLNILEQLTTSQTAVPKSTDNQELITENIFAPGVFHCWTGTPEQAQQVLDLGFYISFSGILTYPTAGHILDAAKIVPLNRLLIETDAPYLVPEPQRTLFRRQKIASDNQPSYVTMTAEKLALVRGQTLEQIAQATTHNARQLFNLP